MTGVQMPGLLLRPWPECIEAYMRAELDRRDAPMRIVYSCHDKTLARRIAKEFDVYYEE